MHHSSQEVDLVHREPEASTLPHSRTCGQDHKRSVPIGYGSGQRVDNVSVERFDSRFRDLDEIGRSPSTGYTWRRNCHSM
jgi:hypothetical protein